MLTGYRKAAHSQERASAWTATSAYASWEAPSQASQLQRSGACRLNVVCGLLLLPVLLTIVFVICPTATSTTENDDDDDGDDNDDDDYDYYDFYDDDYYYC